MCCLLLFKLGSEEAKVPSFTQTYVFIICPLIKKTDKHQTPRVTFKVDGSYLFIPVNHSCLLSIAVWKKERTQMFIFHWNFEFVKTVIENSLRTATLHAGVKTFKYLVSWMCHQSSLNLNCHIYKFGAQLQNSLTSHYTFLHLRFFLSILA